MAHLQICLYMASHKARWGAITSHEQWVFIRLHPGSDPYITFSSVELQENNTRPFRALLAMVLAAELDLEVDSHVNMQIPLETIVEEEEQHIEEDDVEADDEEDEDYDYEPDDTSSGGSYEVSEGDATLMQHGCQITPSGNRSHERSVADWPGLEVRRKVVSTTCVLIERVTRRLVGHDS